MDVDLHRLWGRNRNKPRQKQQPGPRSRQKVAHTEAHLAPYTPYDDDTLQCLPRGATDEERRKNCQVMEEKMRQVHDAIDHPERLPETKGLANKRIKWLKKQIAKENNLLALSKELRVNEWIKHDKNMERQRTRRYEQVDAEHRKRFPESAHNENADAQRRRLARYNKTDNDHQLMLTDQRCPGPIRTPQKIIDRCKAQSAAAVAASSSPSTDEGQRDLEQANAEHGRCEHCCSR